MRTKIIILLFCVNECYQSKVDHDVGMGVCPQILSKYNGSIDELLGNWHVALLVLDETEEKFEERSICIQGRFYKVNSTNLIQLWNIEMPEILRQDKTEIDFPTTIVEPGVWIVRSPMGGQFHGTIIDGDASSYLLIVYCSWQDDKMVHMMTLALSRSTLVTPNSKLQLLATLMRNGYDPLKSKIISWSDCGIKRFV